MWCRETDRLDKEMSALEHAAKLYVEKKWLAALDAYNGCIASGLVVSDDQKSLIYQRLGYGYQQLVNGDEAMNWYSKVIELNRRDRPNANSLYNGGLMYGERREFISALADFNRALTIYTEPKDLGAVYNKLSAVYQQLSLGRLEVSDLQKQKASGCSLVTDSQTLSSHAERLKSIAGSAPKLDEKPTTDVDAINATLARPETTKRTPPIPVISTYDMCASSFLSVCLLCAPTSSVRSQRPI